MERYSRQVLFPFIGESGQNKLKNSAVLVVGIGALGTVSCNHLARAGVGKIRMIDRDYVEFSNLQRQMLFEEEDAQEYLPKVIAAKNKLEKINSEIEIEAIIGNVTNDNIEELVEGMDVIIDGTDNFSTRFLLNDIAFKRNIPYAYGGVVASRGMNAFFIPEKTPCLRCMVNEGVNNGQTCDTVGVISPIVDLISSNQVTEALKYLTGNEDYLRNTLQTIDLWHNQFYEIKFSKSMVNCSTCQKEEFPALERQAHEQNISLCGRNTVQIHQRDAFELNELAVILEKIGTVQKTPFLLKVQIDNQIQFVIFPDGRVLVQGTEDVVMARNYYDRYIGS
ncbi:ThiF family adenylyltransferase [Ornithinibacillus sp. 4-3]|uniref:ThiF family adenylyltransferase n=1 Tax=Ornithinibacillus sp. 4-3 TaxID=3231488 RepID=A0AB39HM84_9BACI